MEQVAVGLTLMLLALIGFSFALSHQLDSEREFRFLFSGIVLLLSALYLRFGLDRVSPLHRAGYRIAVIMMAWAVGLYFFPYPQAVLYLVIVPGFYFLLRIEVKRHKAPNEDKVACGILFLLAILLYVQQQPLQTLLFGARDFDWTYYYHQAPIMVLLGCALTRFQRWLPWDGLATIGMLIILTCGALSLSLVNGARLPVSDLFFLAAISHLLMAFVFISNPLLTQFIRHSGVEQQNLSFPQSIFVLLFIFAQLSLLISLLSYGNFQSLLASKMALPHFLEASIAWSMATLLLTVILPVYTKRHWTVSLVIFEMAVIAAYLVGAKAFASLGFNFTVAALLFVASLLATMVFLKRKSETSHWINNYSFIGVLFCYGFLFLQTSIFTPIGLLGFTFPVLAWGLLPNRPGAKIRRFEAYFWPAIACVMVLCFGSLSLDVLGSWAFITIACPLALAVVINHPLMVDIIKERGWTVLHLWQQGQQKYLLFYALVTLSICIVHFFLNQTSFDSSWHSTLQCAATLILCALATLYCAIKTHRIPFMLLGELMLWLTLTLIRWKLERIEVLQIGTPIDGYIFIGIAILVAGIREKLRHHSPYFSRYFSKSIIVYGLVGWAYLLYLHISGAQALHGEFSSMLMAGLFYWLSRDNQKILKIFVFIFVNIALFLFFIANELNNWVVYLTPAVASALVLTHMFKDELTNTQIAQIRFYCGLLLLGCSSAYNLFDFNSSLWYPVSAALLSAIIVVLGISLRVRIFLYLGSGFIFLNLIGIIANAIINQPPEKTMFAVGLLFLFTGILFVASYLFFQMKREEIKAKYQQISDVISSWD